MNKHAGDRVRVRGLLVAVLLCVTGLTTVVHADEGTLPAGAAVSAAAADVARFDVKLVSGLDADAEIGLLVAPPPAPTEAVEYYAIDALGSVRTVFDDAGNVVGQGTYTPFGTEVAGSAGLPSQRFTGQERDPEAGLDYFGARRYQVRTGRFGTIDPVFSGAVTNPQRWNRYSYALNNPLGFVDPDGRNANACADDSGPYWQEWDEEGAGQSHGTSCGGGGGGGGGGGLFDSLYSLGGVVAGLSDSLLEGLGFQAVMTDPGPNLKFDPPSAWDPWMGALNDGVVIAMAVLDFPEANFKYTGPVFKVTVEGVEDAAKMSSEVGLAERATQIHEILDPIAQSQRTTAVLETGAGRVVAGGARDLSPAQRAILGPGEIPARLPGAHAEITALDAAERLGLTPSEMAVTRTICPECATAIKNSGGTVTSPTTATWPRP